MALLLSVRAKSDLRRRAWRGESRNPSKRSSLDPDRHGRLAPGLILDVALDGRWVGTPAATSSLARSPSSRPRLRAEPDPTTNLAGAAHPALICAISELV
jgi:hypothetical protein